MANMWRKQRKWQLMASMAKSIELAAAASGESQRRNKRRNEMAMKWLEIEIMAKIEMAKYQYEMEEKSEAING
jgi:hypothetical protein